MTWTLPQKTDWMTKQMAHEPTRSYAEEIYDLVKKFPYENALEIGAAWGVSALAILLAGKGKLLSVDKDEYIKAPSEVEANNLGDRWQLKLMPSSDFWQLNDKTFDLIYIDGSHLYDDFRNDIFEAWKVLNPKGLIICDDFVHQANQTGEYGISVAAWEFVKEHKIETVHTTTRLLYIYKAEN